MERREPEHLPVPSPPIATRSVYQLYFGTPMGGIPSAPVTFRRNGAGVSRHIGAGFWAGKGIPAGLRMSCFGAVGNLGTSAAGAELRGAIRVSVEHQAVGVVA